MEASDKVGLFTKREIGLIKNCRGYSANDPFGLPGHNLMVIIAKMADMIDIIVQMSYEIDMDLIADIISTKYDRERGRNPSKILFDQIRQMMDASNFVRRDPISPRSTVEDIARTQGRSVIYICPDGTIRASGGDIVGNTDDGYHDKVTIPSELRNCLPVTFTNDEVFNEWITEVTEVKPSATKGENE